MNLCTLEPLRIPEDIPCLYQMMTAEDQYLFSVRLRFSDEKCFGQWLEEQLRGNFRDLFLIFSVTDHKPLGYIHTYGMSLIDGVCSLVLYLFPRYRSFGIGGCAGLWYADYLFSRYPLRQLQAEIYGYNHSSLKTCLSAGFTEEGVLKDFRYHNGQYNDLHYLVMSREVFYSRYAKLVDRMKTRETGSLKVTQAAMNIDAIHSDDDIDRLYCFLRSAEPSAQMPGFPAVSGDDEFRKMIRQRLGGQYHDLWLVSDDKAKSAVNGYLLAYNYRIYDGHCKLAYGSDNGYPAEPVRLFVDYLHREYPLRKIITETVSSAGSLLDALHKAEFKEEVCLSEHTYCNGEYQNRLILSRYL